MTFRKVAVCDRCAREASTPEPHLEAGPDGWIHILVPLAYVPDATPDDSRRAGADASGPRYVLDLCPRCAGTFGAFLMRARPAKR